LPGSDGNRHRLPRRAGQVVQDRTQTVRQLLETLTETRFGLLGQAGLRTRYGQYRPAAMPPRGRGTNKIQRPSPALG
jgi:hypothetical protein